MNMASLQGSNSPHCQPALVVLLVVLMSHVAVSVLDV
jgi:hypothetical protein